MTTYSLFFSNIGIFGQMTPISVIPESTLRVELEDAKIAIGLPRGKYTSMNSYLRAFSRANKLFTNIRRIP